MLTFTANPQEPYFGSLTSPYSIFPWRPIGHQYLWSARPLDWVYYCGSSPIGHWLVCLREERSHIPFSSFLLSSISALPMNLDRLGGSWRWWPWEGTHVDSSQDLRLLLHLQIIKSQINSSNSFWLKVVSIQWLEKRNKFVCKLLGWEGYFSTGWLQLSLTTSVILEPIRTPHRSEITCGAKACL